MKIHPFLAFGICLSLVLGCAGKVARFDPLSGSRSGYPVTAPVEIVRDQQGVPHILADNADDLFFGLGYAMAQDRFTEIDILRRLARGELAELLGVPIKIQGLSVARVDLTLRTFRFRQRAEQGLAAMAPEERALLESFARGINRFLEDGGETLSFYRLLRQKPAAWRPEDSLALAEMMGMSQAAGSITSEYYLERLRRLVPAEDWAVFVPFYPAGGPIITDDRNFSGWQSRLEVPNGPRLGSNNWVVSGQKTQSGRPLLANDPHVPTFLVPTFWYHVHLRGGGYDVAGMMFPGFPCFGAADNGNVAWALTNVMADHVDLFREKVNPENPDLYLADGEWVPFAKQEEVVPRLIGRPLKFTLRSTRHGVVMDSGVPGWKVDSAADEVLVFKFIDTDLPRFFHGYQVMAKAQNAQEFLAGAKAMGQGPMAWNHVFADTSGFIGYQTTGHIPIRPDHQGVRAREGWDSKNDWQGYIPFEELPRLLNPRKGYIATANNRVELPGYPYYITSDYVSPSRSSRITQLLEAKPKLSLSDMKAIQYDVKVWEAQRWVPILLADLEGAPEPRLQQAAAVLAQWQQEDYRATVDAAGPCLFEMFLEEFPLFVFGDDLPQGLAENLAQTGMLSPALERILEDPDSKWFDDRATKAKETRPDIVRRAMDQAMRYLLKKLGQDSTRWRWGELHHLTLSTTMGVITIPRVTYLIGTFELPGAPETVRASGSMFDPKTGFADMMAGPSTHYLVDFINPREIIWNASTGNSESPEGGRLGNTTQAWLSGDYFTLYLDEARFRQRAMGELVLTP